LEDIAQLERRKQETFKKTMARKALENLVANRSPFF
jgi:hypothetical protein